MSFGEKIPQRPFGQRTPEDPLKLAGDFKEDDKLSGPLVTLADVTSRYGTDAWTKLDSDDVDRLIAEINPMLKEKGRRPLNRQDLFPKGE